MSITDQNRDVQIGNYLDGQHINRASRPSEALADIDNNRDYVPLPYTTTPEGIFCRVLTLPRSPDLLALVLGHIAQLADPEYYDTYQDAVTEAVTQDLKKALSRLSNEDYKGCIMHAGDIVFTAATSKPGYWLPCNGQTVQMADYPELYAAIGATYGPDTATTFTIPDLRGRVPIASGQGPSLTNRIPGQAPGAESVQLAIAQLPSHGHPNAAHSHTESAVGSVIFPSGGGAPITVALGFPSTTGATSINIGPTGQNQPHNNMQPSLVLNAFIFYGFSGI